MSDHIQSTQFPNGVTTPSVVGLTTIQCADGLTLTTTPSPISLGLGAQNVGTMSLKLGNGTSLNGKYSLRLTLGTAVSYVNFEVAAQSFGGNPSMQQTVNITSVTDVDKTVLQFNTVYLSKNNVSNEMAIIAIFATNSPTSTTASLVCDAFGNPAPLSPSLSITNWPVTVSAKINDVRDSFEVLSQRVNGVTISLNNIKRPGTVYVNPTDVGSRPSGSSGVGTCVTSGSSDSTILSQIFTDTQTGKVYSRNLQPDGVTWTAWDSLVKGSDIGDLLNNISIQTMLDAIVFG